jgi:hypothetical protein
MDAAWIVREADMAEKESWLDIPENTGAGERTLAKACARAFYSDISAKNLHICWFQTYYTPIFHSEKSLWHGSLLKGPFFHGEILWGPAFAPGEAAAAASSVTACASGMPEGSFVHAEADRIWDL